jgi:hypothetical protein
MCFHMLLMFALCKLRATAGCVYFGVRPPDGWAIEGSAERQTVKAIDFE